MEAAEKCRIQELKTALCNSQQANLELQKNLSNQSKVQMDLKIERYMMGKQVAMNETDVIDKVWVKGIFQEDAICYGKLQQ